MLNGNIKIIIFILIYIDYGLTSSWTSMALLNDQSKSIEEISHDAN